MSLWSRLVNVMRGDRLIAEIDEEFESHIAEAIAHGRDAEEARRAFGGSLRQREASRDIKRMAWPADCLMDLRRAVRAVWRHRALTSAVVGSLALGMGVNTAIFSLSNSLILKSLPVKHSDRLVRVTPGGDFEAWTYPLWEQLQAHQAVLEGVFAWSSQNASFVSLDGRRGRPRERSVGECELLRRSWRSADPRPYIRGGRRSPRRRSGRARRRRQPSLLATPLPWRRGRGWSDALDRARPLHRGRGHAAGLLRATGRVDVRCRDSHRDATARAATRSSRSADLVVAASDGPAQVRSGGGECGGWPGAASTGPPRPDETFGPERRGRGELPRVAHDRDAGTRRCL